MDEEWKADVEAERLSSGLYAPVLVIIPPKDVGPPLRRVLRGELPSEEHAKFVALDAFAEMTRRPTDE